jgi:hypothetical protein
MRQAPQTAAVRPRRHRGGRGGSARQHVLTDMRKRRIPDMPENLARLLPCSLVGAHDGSRPRGGHGRGESPSAAAARSRRRSPGCRGLHLAGPRLVKPVGPCVEIAGGVYHPFRGHVGTDHVQPVAGGFGGNGAGPAPARSRPDGPAASPLPHRDRLRPPRTTSTPR